MKSKLHFGKALKIFFGLFLLLSFFLFGVFGFGLKVNANVQTFQRYENEFIVSNYDDNVALLQIPNYQSIILQDDSNYPILKIKYGDTYYDYLSVKRGGTDSFNLYGYMGVNLQKYITAYEFIGIYIYTKNVNSIDYYYMRVNKMSFDSQTRSLYVSDILINDTEIGELVATKYVYTCGISYGHFYTGMGADSPYNDAAFTARINNFLAPQYGDIFDAVSASEYHRGYTEGWGVGYQEGQDTITPFDRFWAILTGIFSSVGSVLSIQLFPGVPLGVFILIPLFFGAVGLILWIWRRN